MSSSPPLVSVIIPVFNDPIGIENCLDALAQQTYPADRFEVIVVDNGSTPPLSLRSNRSLQLKIEICSRPGSYAARNAGARIARGDILAFTDADCTPAPDWLREAVAESKLHGPLHVIGGEVLIRAPARRSGVALYQYMTGFQQRENVLAKGYAATANLFCTRKTFEAVGPFDERLLSGGDRDWSWRAQQAGAGLTFSACAAVTTDARTSLRSAIRQARRVAAGRRHLHQHGLVTAGIDSIKPHRSIGESINYIAKNTQLTPFERARVLFAASVLKGVAWVESLRLALGGKAERR